MVAIALVAWLVATVLVAVPVGVVLRRMDGQEVEELIDPVELRDAMRRHPSQSQKVA